MTEEISKILFSKPRKYLCEKHGEVEYIISSNIPSFEGVWCQKCWLESLGKPIKEITE